MWTYILCIRAENCVLLSCLDLTLCLFEYGSLSVHGREKVNFYLFLYGGRVSKTCRIVAWTVLSVICDD